MMMVMKLSMIMLIRMIYDMIITHYPFKLVFIVPNVTMVEKFDVIMNILIIMIMMTSILVISVTAIITNICS